MCRWSRLHRALGVVATDSEYFRDLIRRDQERHAGLEQLRAALVAGEQSGISERTPQEIREMARERLKQDGIL